MKQSTRIDGTCTHCGTAFSFESWRLKHGPVKYCSRLCYNSARARIARSCATCGVAFHAKPSDVRHRASNYCSPQCYWEAKPVAPEVRFWRFVKKTDSCWLWQGYCMPNGYGSFGISREHSESAHRYSWMLHHGPIPDGLLVLHNCPGKHNRACVNPAHLKLGDQKENMADREQQRTQRLWHPKGKLTESQILAVRQRYAAGGVCQHTLAREYGVSQTTIGRIVLRKTWKHLP